MAQTASNISHQATQDLIRAVMLNDVEKARAALDAGANINTFVSRHNNDRALKHAVMQGKHELAELLLGRGALTAKRIEEKTLLFDAIEKRDVEMVRLLLRHGMDPNERCFRFDSAYPQLPPLALACISGSRVIVGLLLEHGADVHQRVIEKDNRIAETAVYYAVAHNRLASLTMLFAAGASADMQPRQWEDGTSTIQSYLYDALTQNRLPLLRLLLEAGADGELRNEKGQTPLEKIKAQLSNQVRNWDKAEALFAEFARYPRFRPEMLGQLTKAQLLATDEGGFCLLDSPSFWRHFDEVAAHLRGRGEVLTVEELHRRNPDGKSYNQRAAESFATPALLDYYRQEHGCLPLQDMAETLPGAGSPFLEAAFRHGQLAAVFNEERWRNHSALQLSRAYHSLSAEARAELPNYQMLKLHLTARECERGR